MTIGIYKITNLINGKDYFGQSKNVERRLKQHKTKLRGGYHDNNHLQNSWNKYGEENFSFKLVKACKERYLDRFEKLYIHLNKTMDPNYGYNKDSGGHANKTESPETRAKKSESQRGEKSHLYGKYGEDHPRYGIIESAETRAKKSKATKGMNNPRAKYTMWNIEKVHYKRETMFQNKRDGSTPCRCFKTKYKGKQLPIGHNLDFVTCEIIHDLINDAIK